MVHEIEEYACPPGEACIKPLLHRGFGLFWEHKKLLIGAHLILLAILLCGDFLLRGIGGHVILGPFLLGMYKIALSVVRNQDTNVGDILAGFEQFLPAFIANIAIHILAFFGFWLLILPGFLVFLAYSTTYFFILEENKGFWDAMEASRKMTFRNKKLWLTLGAFIFAINVAGFLCFIIGLAVTVPYSHMLVTLAYEESLKGEV